MKISILSAVWNEELHIKEMIDSVLQQTHADFELLIADDGSTDGTVAAVHAATSDPRVKLVHSGEKLGKVGAFNACYAASTGEVIVLLAGDDVLPSRSLQDRYSSLKHVRDPGSRRAASFAKLKTFSFMPKFDGIVSPRGNRGNRSGGTVALTRALADEIFPIPSELVSEDIWLAEVVALRAEEIVEAPVVVLQYRIHPGNSNPRHLPYKAMSEAMHRRMHAYDLLLLEDRFDLTAQQVHGLQRTVRLEQARFDRRMIRVLREPGVPVVARARAAFGASPLLFSLRTRFYKLFSAW